MPLPRPEVILLAKSYAHRLELGETPAEAGVYIRNRFPGSIPYQINSAIRQAQRAMEVGETLAQMGPDEFIREALGGRRAPARTVGVRVEMSQWLTDSPQGDPWRVNTLYVEVPWDATVQEVWDRANEWLASKPGGGYNVRHTDVAFVGPTLWPGGTPGLRME